MHGASWYQPLLAGYGLAVLIEGAILLAALSPVHSIGRRAFAGAWLTACSYPIVILVMPLLPIWGGSRALYLIAAETFAPAAECVLFLAAFGVRARARRATVTQDCAVIVAANLASFGAGELVNTIRMFG